MGHDDWERKGDGTWVNWRPDGTVLVYKDSWGGNREFNHVHMSAAEAERQFAVYKPAREWYKKSVGSGSSSGGSSTTFTGG